MALPKKAHAAKVTAIPPVVPTKDTEAVPPGKRVSIFKSNYPNSTEGEWHRLDGLGWYHTEERYMVNDYYRKSVLTNNWFPNERALKFYQGGYCCKEELGDKYFVDEVTDVVYRIEDLSARPVYTNEMRKQVVSTHTRHNYFAKCPVLDKYLPASGFTTFNMPDRGKLSISLPAAQELTTGDEPAYSYCEVCEEYYISASIKLHMDARGRRKRTCFNCRQKVDVERAIHRFDDKLVLKAIHVPRFNLRKGVKTEIPNPRLFGVECELGFSNDLNRFQTAADLTAHLGTDFCYMKHDGSINNHGNGGDKVPQQGFEIVSAPCDIDIHRERWKAIETYKDYKHFRAWDTDTCGMHIHVSRAALSTMQIGRILVFINHPKNKGFVQKVAGRSEVKWTKYYEKGFRDVLHPENTGDRDHDRRVSVNLQNRDTVEFRIFRGTVKYRHIIRNIEFVDAICDFSLPNWRSIQDAMDYRKFIAFCSENRKFYPLLSEWAEHVGVIKQRKLPPGASPPEVEESGFIKGRDL